MGNATKIPINASPVIKPEANSKPLSLLFLIWHACAIIPPMKIGVESSMGKYMPTAIAKTGSRKVDFLFSCMMSNMIIKIPMIPPAIIIFQGRFPENTPSATDFIKVACGAGKSTEPISYAVCNISKTRPSIIAAEIVPTICMTCCFHGVAPTICPVFKSCKLSPPMAAAQHTTAPIMIAPAAPAVEPEPNIVSKSNEEKRIVAMVTPETGLFDEPTIPAIYDATAENKKPNINMTIDNKIAIGTVLTISK